MQAAGRFISPSLNNLLTHDFCMTVRMHEARIYRIVLMWM